MKAGSIGSGLRRGWGVKSREGDFFLRKDLKDMRELIMQIAGEGVL